MITAFTTEVSGEPGPGQGHLPELAAQPTDAIVGRLAASAAEAGIAARPEQHNAWVKEVEFLRAAASELLTAGIGAGWGTVLEFELPRRAVRPDVVVLVTDVIVPIEFKVGAHSYERSARMQVEEYAWDLRDFHLASRNRPIVPVLVATEASSEEVDLGTDRAADRAQCTTPGRLGALLRDIANRCSRGAPQLDLAQWEHRPLPAHARDPRRCEGHVQRPQSARNIGLACRRPRLDRGCRPACR